MSTSDLSSITNTTNTANTTSQSTQSQAALNGDMNDFLNLLVTQLQHQDPLKPMDATQFTNQLVQFASVEQEINTNSHLEDLVSLQQQSQVASMVNYLGTTVEATGKDVNLDNGSAKFSYSLAENARSTNITITDADGKVVDSMTGELSSGDHTATWDGKDLNGNQLPDGKYTITVTALDPDGKPIDVSQTVTGRVTGAGTENGDTVLYMGDVSVPMGSILSVNQTAQQQASTN